MNKAQIIAINNAMSLLASAVKSVNYSAADFEALYTQYTRAMLDAEVPAEIWSQFANACWSIQIDLA